MCGIAGFFTAEDKKIINLDDFFKDITLMSQLRGKDSTGMLFLDGNYDLSYEKKAMQAADFLDLAKIQEKVREVDNYYGALVHCRARTTGLTNQETAHPFIETDTSGAINFGMIHNGTLKTWDKKEYLSDSQYLAKKLYVDGYQETLETLDGAAALVWVDQRIWKNYMYTNGERPLVYGFLEKSNTIILGSEAHLLYAALERNNLKLENKKFYNCTKNVLYELDPSDIRKIKTETIVPKKSIVVITQPENKSYRYKNTIKEDIAALVKETLNLEKVEPTTQKRITITSDETKEFFTKTGLHSAEALARIIFYDATSKELMLEVEDIDYSTNIVYSDAVVMRGIKEEYYNYLVNKFDQVCVTLVGVQYDSALQLMPTWIALSNHQEKNSVLKEKALVVLN